MKKTISAISASIFGCTVSSAVYADRFEKSNADENITIYGIMNVDIDNVRTTSNGVKINVTRISSNSSRLGFRGIENLGGGLSAIFQIESKVNADTGGGAFAARETFVGLHSNDIGAIKLGNMDPPIDEIKGIYGNAPTGVTSILSTQAIINNNSGDAYGASNAGKNNGLPTMNDTMPNALKYESPKFGNIYVDMMYSHPANETGAGPVPHNMGSDIVYADGRIKAALATQRNTDVRGPGLSDATYLLTGGMNFGPLYLALVYNWLSANYSGGTVKRNFWGASSTYSVGVGKVYAFYGKVGNGSLDHPGLSQTGANMFELSYTYAMSKRTSLYWGYIRINNQANATYQLGVNGISGGTTDAGASVSGAIAGIKNSF